MDLDYEGYLNIFTGDQVNVTGQVGVCRNGSYGRICDVNWDANDATVLCRTIIPRKIILDTTLIFSWTNIHDQLPCTVGTISESDLPILIL